MTRFIFSYLPDLVDPASKPYPNVGVLTVAGETFISFVWLTDPESIVEGAFMREVFATYAWYLKILIDEDWPLVKNDPRATGLVDYVVRTHTHSNLYVSRIEEDVPVPTWPPPGEA